MSESDPIHEQRYDVIADIHGFADALRRLRHRLQYEPVPQRLGQRGDESFFSSLKTERTGRKACRTRNAARADAFDYIERFYNAVRRHSTIGYLSPVEFERKVGLT